RHLHSFPTRRSSDLPDRSSATFVVYDEYGQITPSGPVTVNPDGTFSFKVTLGPPKGGDKDGREFQIMVKARDLAGNAGSRTVLVDRKSTRLNSSHVK